MDSKNVKIGVIGLGYVGLPLAIEFSHHYKTVGYDKNKSRIEQLENDNDVTMEVDKKTLSESRLILSNKPSSISKCNVYIITVPTPINKNKSPNLSPLKSASKLIGKYLKRNDIVIYESTVYPGATEEFCVPILEKYSKLKYKYDFHCGYSPERINPGDKKHTLKKIIKIVSGSSVEILDFIEELYKKIITAGVHRVSSISVAEAAKVIENTQRDVNIALMNELSIIFKKLNLDTSEVIKAACTKWNFLEFYPGLVGGHCIGVDPYYMTYKAIEVGHYPEVILAGRRINDNMGGFIVENLILHLSKRNININQANIAILGITFKENCPDLRNSKVFDIIDNLKSHKSNLFISDYWANPKEAKKDHRIDLVNFELLKNMDAVIVAVGHEQYKEISVNNYEKILNKDGVLFDVKSLYDKITFNNSNIYHWRL